MEASGLPVHLDVLGEQRELPAGIDVSAYRVVQEGLTNALKHSPGSSITIEVTRTRGYLDVDLRNGPSAAQPATDGLARTGGANGINGLRERISAIGGTLSAGPSPDDGWQLRARLPQ